MNPVLSTTKAVPFTLESSPPAGEPCVQTDPNTEKALLRHWGGNIVNRLEVPWSAYAVAINPSGTVLACVVEAAEIVSHTTYGTQLLLYHLPDGPRGSSANLVKKYIFDKVDGRARGGTPRHINRTLQFSDDGEHLLLGVTWGDSPAPTIYNTTAEVRVYSLATPSQPVEVGTWQKKDLNLNDLCFGADSSEIFVSCSEEPQNFDPLGLWDSSDYRTPSRYKLLRLQLSNDGTKEISLLQGGLPQCRGFEQLRYQRDKSLLFVLEEIELGPGLKQRFQVSTLEPTSGVTTPRPFVCIAGPAVRFDRNPISNTLWITDGQQCELIDQTNGTAHTYTLPAYSHFATVSGEYILVPHQMPVLDRALDVYSIQPPFGSAGLPVRARFQSVGLEKNGLLDQRACYITGWNHSAHTGLTAVSVVEHDIERAWKGGKEVIIIAREWRSYGFSADLDPKRPTSKSTIFLFET